MALSSSSKPTILLMMAMVMILSSGYASAQLSTKFYSSTCPKLFSTVIPLVKSAVSKEKRMGASLLRLFFHDCFVGGCDGSVLLDDTKSFTGEKTAIPNNGSIRGFEVIDKIKAQVEKLCPGVVSCADILAIAARDSVVLLGGPSWKVKLGRRDSKTANRTAANNQIPPPFSNLVNLTAAYAAKGLSTKDMVALSGAHTIGKARCSNFRAHLYNDTNINSSFAKIRQTNCPKNVGSQDNNLAPLDLQSQNVFDNSYFKLLLNKKGLLHSDQELFNGGSTDSLVRTYANNPSKFSTDFVAAMIKMGDITPLTGSKGQIRKNCRKIN